jgi:hypothetical protein
MHRFLAVILASVLAAGSFGLASGSAGLPCLADLDVQPWQGPRPVADAHFSSLFPGLGLVVTDDRSRLPEIPRLWAVTPDGYCSLALLPELVAAYRGSLDSENDLVGAAWLAALQADTEVMGLSVFDRVKAVERSADGARVTLVALSPATGTEVEWTVDVGADGSASARWEVLRLVPEIRTDLRGWFIGPGDTGPFDDTPGQAATLQRLYPTHDGKNIRITYFTERYASDALAHEDADRNGMGGVLAYDLMNDVWGFPSADPDGFLDITVSGCACIFGGAQVNILMPPNVLQWVNAFGFTYTDADEVAYLIIAHEFFHHFQWSTMQWNQGSWVVEGTARFIETILYPGQAHQPGSIQYAGGSNGFPYVMQNPDLPPQQHSYSYGLVWGHIYDMNGGVQFFKRLFEESAAGSAFPGFVDRALASMGGAHATLGDALRDIGVRMVARSFEWETWDGSASYDWGVYLPAVKQENLPGTPLGGTWETSMQPYAMKFLRLPPTGPTGGVVIAVLGAPSVAAAVVTSAGGSYTNEPVSDAYVATSPADMRHVFVVNDPGLGSTTPPLPGGQFRAAVLHV